MAGAEPPESLRTIPDLVAAKAAANADEPYLQYKDETVSYEAFHRQSNAVANELDRLGISHGDQVCLFMYNSPAYLLTYVALAKLGAVAVPIDTRFTGETLAWVLSETAATTILVDDETREDYEAVRDEITNITTEYFVGEQETEAYRSFDSLLEGDDSTPETPVTESDLLSIAFGQQYVSDQPKGVMLPQYAFISAGWEVSQNQFDYSAGDCIFTTLPLYSLFTVQLGAIGAMMADARFVIEDPFDPTVFWEQVDHYEATILLYLGRMLSVLYNNAREVEHTDNTLEKALGHGYGFGFATDEKLVTEFESLFDITVFEGYGAAETGSVATYNSPHERKAGSSGTPISYAEVAIVDDDDRLVEPGESGEIVVRPTRANTMFKGYYEDPEATVQTTRNQWIHTGGMGYIDEDGFLHFVANEMNAIYRGKITGRISSLEIESVINAHPAVAASAVVGVENHAGNEEIKAVVVPAADASLDPVAVCRHCEQQLPRIKVPRYVEIREELPRNSTGNTDKAALRADAAGDVWDRKSGYELSY